MRKLLTRLATSFPLACFLLLLAPFAAKTLWLAIMVYRMTGAVSGLHQVLANDSPILLGVVLLTALSLSPRLPGKAATALRLGIVGAMAVYVADVIIFFNFGTRLDVIDINIYSSHALTYFKDVLAAKRALVTALYLLITANACRVFVMSGQRYAFRPRAAVVLSCVLVVAAAQLPENKDFTHAGIYDNLIVSSMKLKGMAREYSDAYVAAHLPVVTHPDACLQGGAAAPAGRPVSRPNIILLVVESLSSYQSRFFSGLNGWTPELDRIAAQNEAYVAFSANGFNTNDGLIALLTGQVPLHAPRYYTNTFNRLRREYSGSYQYRKSLPLLLGNQGYRTEFLTAGDTDYCDFLAWAESIGYHRVEGNESPFYKGCSRFTVNAYPDGDLYRRMLARLAELAPGVPFFMTAMTSSMHFPYAAPGVEHSEEGVVRYADAQIGLLYDALRASGFFESGLLVIVGDHRAMTPVTKAEIERFGPLQAEARIPLVVCGQGVGQKVETRKFQQLDVYESLASLFSGANADIGWRGRFLGTPRRTPQYIFQRRGRERNQLAVFSERGEYAVVLDGDDTRFVGPAPPDKAEAEKILTRINLERIRHAD